MKEPFEKTNATNLLIVGFCGACMVICALSGDSSTVSTIGTGLIGFLGGVAITKNTEKEN